MTAETARLRTVTANRLREGDVVYLTACGRWSPRLAESRVSDDDTVLQAMMAQADADVAGRLIVTPYLMEVVEVDGELQPLSAREMIRAAGPTVRADYRKAGPERSRAA
jgi:hypothetical protein